MSELTSPTVTPYIAERVLGFFGDPEGIESGDFLTNLMKAAAHADREHSKALSLGFPGLMEAMNSVKVELNGLRDLRTIARGR